MFHLLTRKASLFGLIAHSRYADVK
uniref:Uncharacterized protein n=1 Tax=Anguilla anguilla TaxID=7936 RepID=A0A0E9TI94_ANGAN